MAEQRPVQQQTISDIQARTQDGSKAGQIIGNFNSLVMLRVKDDDVEQENE